MERNNTNMIRDAKKTVRTGVRTVGFVFGVFSLFSILLPYVSIRLDDVIVRLTGLQVLMLNIRLSDGQLLTLPMTLRIAMILSLLGGAAGIALLATRKYTLSGVSFFSSLLLVVAQTLFFSEMEQAAVRAGVSACESENMIGYGLMIAFLLVASASAILMTGIEKAAESIFKLSASISIGIVAAITIYMFAYGSPAILEIGLFRFLFGTTWAPSASQAQFGIWFMILASLFSCMGAIVIGVPVGIFTAVFLAEIAPKWMGSIVRPAVELLAGIPSVIYGFWGMKVLVPILRSLALDMGINSTGSGLLAVILILSVMILPTIIRVAETALLSVPKSYTEASLALGNTKVSTIFQVQIPAARSGILAGVILGVGRAIGETMAVIMVAGNIVKFPELFSSIRPLTAGIAFEMGYAEAGLHRQALFGIGLVLFVFIMLVNISFNFLSRRGVQVDAK